MQVIQYHDMTQAEYSDATITSVIAGSTWLRMPKVYGCETVWFVAAETPREIVEHFAAGKGNIRVQVYGGVLPAHE